MGSICAVACCKSPAETEVNEATRTSNYTIAEPRNGCFDVVVNSEATTGSAEFERCPHCHDVFPLPYLVDHAHNCTGSVLELNKAIKTAIATGPLSISPPTECSIASYDLPKKLMSKPYPKWERKHFPKSRSKGTSTVEEFQDDPAVLPEHLIQMNDLSTRWTIEDDWSTHSLATSRTTKNESTDRQAEDSKGLEWISSPCSYYDCEEQCLYCLQMFAVSVLVEHACNCPSRQENSADELTDFGQCCYCLQTLPLKDVLNHVPNCDHKTVSSSGDVLERCIHCFKDFPVSELIHHSQNCRGGMSGPRERFHGFTPSVHDLSAISSAAILNDTQHKALDYVIKRSAQDSKSVASALLSRVQRLGYSENDLKKTLQWVRSASPIIIHINLDKVLKFLVEDTNYRNRFETSSGSTYMEARKSWEDRIFNKAYHSSPPSERVKYGVLNIVGDPRGVRKCALQYGDSFLQLKKVRLRTTFASEDTSSSTVKLSCCEHYENVLFSYTDQEIKAIIDVATGKVLFHRSDCISQYKEVQIHGPVSLSENVECIVVNPRHKKDSVTTKLLDRFVEQNKCNLIWMDPDDLTEAGPSSLGGRSHYLSARSLLRPSPHKRSDKWRRSSLCETRASFPAESKRRILTESKPRTISDSKRGTHSDSKPTVFSGIKPETFGKPMPSFASESRYRTLIREPKSSILSEKKSGIRSESKPGANSESKFRNLSDSKPRTISSSRLSYRDTTRIRTRRPATAGRRERWSSLRDSSREKYPYF